MPLDPRILGQKTAISLMKEMRFLGKLKNEKKLGDLLDIPDRDKLSFQLINGQDSAKSELSKGHFGADLAGLRFCVADGEVERVGMMDIDHTVPFKYIHNKQEALLVYLNDPANADFTAGFLNADAIIDGRKISSYFKRNISGQILGTRLFFRLCYNDIDNLLLICHACNTQKGAQDSLEWFKKQEPFLGKRFVEAVTIAGGLHDGIIVQKVYMAAHDCSDIIKIGKFNCRIHDGECRGLGEFVNDWFEKENPGYAKSVIKAYSSVWLELKEIWELQLKENNVAGDSAVQGKENRIKAIKLTTMLDAQIKAVEKYYDIPKSRQVKETSKNRSSKSHSTSDGSCDRKIRIHLINTNTSNLLFYMHNVKKIISLINKKDAGLQVTQIYDLFLKLNVQGHTLEQQKKIFEEILRQREDTTDPIQGIITNAVEKVNPIFQKLKEATEEKNKAEAREIEERESRLAAEESLANLQKELDELRPLLQLKLKSEALTPLSSVTESSTGNGMSSPKRIALSPRSP